MLSVENNKILLPCLEKVKDHFINTHSISIFEFNPMQANGCDGHPSLKDHQVMAEELIPFYANVLQN